MNEILKAAFKPLLGPVRRIWSRLPDSVLATRAMRSVGSFIYDNFVRDTNRNQSHMTRFMRNVPQLEALRDLISRSPQGATLRIASIGCSTGVELHSTLWVIRSARPDLRVVAKGVDISPAVVEFARRGVFRAQPATGEEGLQEMGQREVTGADSEALQAMLEPVPGGNLRVRDWLREGVYWLVGDATDPQLFIELGPQDLVLACNFLGPMEDPLAEACLRGIVHLIAPNGVLVLDGIDLDLKARVVPSLGLTPITDRIEEAHVADPTKSDWPWKRWSHEPFDRRRPDWAFRYSTIFVKSAP
jgi:chemotaxis protein methyltransferase CheR